MEKLTHYQPRDEKTFLKCFRRAEMDYVTSYLSEEDLLSFAEDGTLWELKDGARPIGGIAYSHDVKSFLYPESHSEKKYFELLSSSGYRGEDVFFLAYLFIDPSYRGKKRAKELFRSAQSQSRLASWFTLLPESREPVRPFLKELGFFALPVPPNEAIEKEGCTLLLKKNLPSGLCDESAF